MKKKEIVIDKKNREFDIDIIIPIYNSEKYIIETLESFEKSSYKQYRLILVNDGSTDNTEFLIKKYIQEKNNNLNIKLILQENLGREEARNEGIKNIEAKYVLFFDSDDLIEKEALNLLKKNIEQGYDLVFGSYRKIGMSIFKEYIQKEKIYLRNETINKFFKREIGLGIGNTLIKSEIIKNNKLFFEKYEYGEDNHFFRKLLFYTNKSKGISENIFNYIQHEDSTMYREFTLNRFNVLKSIENTQEFYSKEEKDKDIMISNLDIFYNLEFLGLIKYIANNNINFKFYQYLVKN